MLEHGIHHVPVTGPDGAVIGVVTDTDLMGLERKDAFALRRSIERTDGTDEIAGALRSLPGVVVGLVDLAFIPLQSWRDSGVPGWYSEQLGLDYEGLSGLPENWVFNTGDETNPLRRLVSTFLSPLASAYVLVVALVYVLSRPFRWWWGLLALLCYVALL